MTDLLDLATLATLGQHFPTHEDVAQLKGALTSLQNDLSLIKNFLLLQFGSDFTSALVGNDKGNCEEEEEHQEQETSKDLTITEQTTCQKSKSVGNRSTSARKSSQENNGYQQQHLRPRPPPLQRFTRINKPDNGLGNLGSISMISSKTDVSPSQAPTVKSEKFHRNFLSMRSLKSGSSGTSHSRSQPLQRISTGNNNSVFSKSSSLLCNTINGTGVKVEPPNTGKYQVPSASSTIGKRIRTGGLPPGRETYMEDGSLEGEEEFNASEEAYAAVTVSEGGMNYEDNGEDDFGYVAYDEADYQEGDYDDSMSQDVYQEDDGNIYEDYYSMEGLEITHTNSSSMEPVPPSSVHRGASTAKKTQQRRLSLPVTASSTSGITDGTGVVNNPIVGGDPNFLKKCKVCHEEVPSYSLFNHVVSAHYKGEVPTCTICKKTFTYKQGLISHMRYHDAEKYDKACSYCGKKFIRRSDVIIHERRLHTGERPFQCPVPDCNQSFVRRYCLLTHVKTNHGEPYMSKIARGELTT